MYKELNTPYVHFELQDDLLIAKYKKDQKLNLQMVQEIVKARLEFTNYQPHLVLIYNLGIKSFDKQARDYLVSEEGVRGVVAAAYILGNPFVSFFINFFVTITKAKVPMPVRTFSRKEAALKWLDKHRKKTNP